MAPRSEATHTAHSHRRKTEKDDETTVIVDPDKSGLTYVRCSSIHDFYHPTADADLTPEQINSEHLNLNLGLPIEPENHLLRKVLRFLSQVLLMWYEQYIFDLWCLVPVWLRQKVSRIHRCCVNELIHSFSSFYLDDSLDYVYSMAYLSTDSQIALWSKDRDSSGCQ
jgi:hypothetical protein